MSDIEDTPDSEVQLDAKGNVVVTGVGGFQAIVPA